MSSPARSRWRAGPVMPIALAALGGILLLIVTGTLWAIQRNTQLVQDEQRRAARLMADGLAIAVATPLMRKDYGGLEARLMQTASLPGIRSALVTDARGRVLGQVRRAEPNAPAQPVFDIQTLRPPARLDLDLELPRQDAIMVWRPVEVGVPIGWIRLEIGTQRSMEIIDRMRRDAWILAGTGALAGIVLLGEAMRRSLGHLRRREAETRQVQERLEDMAYHDSLTGLPNRLLLTDRMQQAIARSIRDQVSMTACFVDIDDFKAVNDSHGHEVGDRLLVEVARRLRETMRGGDTVARLAGDEFVVLLGDLHDGEETVRAVRRLLDALTPPVMLADQPFEPSCSIGYAVFPSDATSADTLLAQADRAMYEAKQAGGGRFVRYAPEMAAARPDMLKPAATPSSEADSRRNWGSPPPA